MEPTEIIVNLLFGAWVIVIIYGFIQSRKGNVIVFIDFDDLALCFGTFVVPIIIAIVGMYLGLQVGGLAVAALVFVGMLVYLVKQTYYSNGNSIKRTFISILTKVPLGLLWVGMFYQMLVPSGNSRSQRTQSRGRAVFILTFLTPIILMVVNEKTSRLFNPASFLQGRRFSGAIDLRRQLESRNT